MCTYYPRVLFDFDSNWYHWLRISSVHISILLVQFDVLKRNIALDTILDLIKPCYDVNYCLYIWPQYLVVYASKSDKFQQWLKQCNKTKWIIIQQTILCLNNQYAIDYVCLRQQKRFLLWSTLLCCIIPYMYYKTSELCMNAALCFVTKNSKYCKKIQTY